MICLKDFLPEDSDAAKEAHKQGLVSAGWGYWKDKNGNTVAKTINGKLEPLKQPELPHVYKKLYQKVSKPQSSKSSQSNEEYENSLNVMIEHSREVQFDEKMQYAAQWYTQTNYHHINTCLRKYKGNPRAYVVDYAVQNGDAQPGEDVTQWDDYYKKLEAELTSSLKNLDKLILKNKPIPQSVRLYRGSGWQGLSGISMPRQGMHDMEIANEARKQAAEKLHQLKGSTLRDSGYVSTSLNSKTAYSWKSGVMDTVVMEIDAPQGTHGIYLDHFGWNDQGEDEVLLPRNTQFRVKDVRGDLISSPVVITLEVIPETPKTGISRPLQLT